MSKDRIIYNFSDQSVRTESGRIIATAPNLTAVAVAFPGVTITVLRGGLNPLAKD